MTQSIETEVASIRQQPAKLPEAEEPPPTTLQVLGRSTQERDWQQFLVHFLTPDTPNELVTALRPLARGDSPSKLERSGYVVHSLQTALHDGLFADSAEEAIVTAVNRGGDTDTIGAIAGAVAGARFGVSQILDRWLSAIDEVDEFEPLAERLVEVA